MVKLDLSKRPIIFAAAAAIPIAFSVANAQTNFQLVDIRTGRSGATQQGWPFHFLIVEEFSGRSLPQSGGGITRRIDSLSLALDFGVWILMVGSSMYLAWIIAAKRIRITAAHLLGFTTFAGLLFWWWNTRYQLVVSAAHYLGDSPVIKQFLIITSEDALLRLMTFSFFCKTGIVVGMLCVGAVGVDLVVVLSRRRRAEIKVTGDDIHHLEEG